MQCEADNTTPSIAKVYMSGEKATATVLYAVTPCTWKV